MDFAQQIKSAVNIVEIVGEHVRLKKQGANRYVGLCPFHSEKTPSFSVSESLQIYKCFGCGKGGDVFRFLMEMQGLSFFESLQALAERQGIPMPRRSAEASDADSRFRAALYHLHEQAQVFFEQQLRSSVGQAARAYLAARDVAPEAWSLFGIGYAPAGGSPLTRLLQQRGISREHLEAGGVVSKDASGSRWYDRFRDRLIFPIHSESGKVIAFAGRALRDDQQPKYLNSPETLIYKKSAVLYNLHRAKQAIRAENRVVLVEGYMDVIGVVRAGVPAVVASCGTALTSQQARMMRRHAEAVVVNFDPDPAGQGAAQRSVEILLQEGLKVRVLTLPEELDPDEFCSRHGAEQYEELLRTAPDYFLWLADRARERFDVHTSEGRMEAFRFLVPSIQILREKIHRVTLANELAAHLGVEQGLVLEQFRRAAAERRDVPSGALPEGPFSKSEKMLLRLLIESQEAREEMLEEAVRLTVEEDLPCRPILEALQAVMAQGAFSYAGLEGRLEEQHREALSRLIFERDSHLHSIEDGRQALVALRRRAWERRYQALQREIVEAERAKNQSRALDLLREKKEHEARGRLMGCLQSAAHAATAE